MVTFLKFYKITNNWFYILFSKFSTGTTLMNFMTIINVIKTS